LLCCVPRRLRCVERFGRSCLIPIRGCDIGSDIDRRSVVRAPWVPWPVAGGNATSPVSRLFPVDHNGTLPSSLNCCAIACEGRPYSRTH
jgi:hypothetical protein